MQASDYLEMVKDIDEYKILFETALDTYGVDMENYIARFTRSIARVQREYYDELVKAGFNQQQSFTLLLDARNAMKNIDLASRSK